MRGTILSILAIMAFAAPALAADGFVTAVFGGKGKYADTRAGLAGGGVKFDLSALPAATKVHRAVLRVPPDKRQLGQSVKVVPDLPEAKPLELLPPFFDKFDATAAVREWVARPQANKGLKVEAAGGCNFARATLEVSFAGKPDQAVPAVKAIKALHQDGQTFLTWQEIEDPVGQDDPKFEDFHNLVMAARAQRGLTYRVYRHDQPITLENLGQARLVREVPEVVGIWNLRAVRNTEHPNQGFPTMNSPLRSGLNMVKADIVPRFRIIEDAQPLPRATGLAVFTVAEPGKRYYAVTAAIDGGEAVAALDAGSSLAQPVDEKVSPFPAIVRQRTLGEKAPKKTAVDIHSSWLEPPYHNVPGEFDLAVTWWDDLPERSAEKRVPLWVVTTTYGGSTTELSPGWFDSRHYLRGVFTVGLAEGGIWQGFHECLGTLKGYDQGVVCNYPQRRVLSAAAWAKARPDFFVDPERVYFWSQLGSWALRHGDVFAAVMSNAYGNPAIGAIGNKHGSSFGPYPRASKNWLGIDQWEYANIAKWVRENPSEELPFWVCAPAYGAYPAHTVGDFGFMPWPETIHALASTKRAFAATWNTNGPGVTAGLHNLITRIKLHQSLPAFTNCSVDASPGDGDHADSEKSGGINVWQLWEPETIVDEPGKWEITLCARPDCPYADFTTDVTPRRCQKFKAKEGETFQWTLKAEGQDKVLQQGAAKADKWGLVTVEKIKLTKDKARLAMEKKP